MAEADNPMLAEEPATRELPKRRRRVLLKRLALVVVAGALIWMAWYFIIGQHHVTTDNAYVNAEVAQVTPLISATVVEVKVKDTQAVKAGDVLVQLDPANMRIGVSEATAALADARRRFRQTVATAGALSAQVDAREAEIASAKAQLGAAQADFEKALTDFNRRQALASSGAVSGDELTSARKALASARAALASAKAGIAQAQSTRASAQGELAATRALVSGSTEETDPGVLAAKARLESARLDLDNTVIRARVAGIVTGLKVQVGQRVTQGNPIMSIVPVDKVYVDANFKERQLNGVKVGMPATIKADIYGSSVVYHGKVAGFSGGTGASMALIPAQNATGNWIKVVQRLPVRIELDPKELDEHPLRVGLSTEVDIDISGS